MIVIRPDAWASSPLSDISGDLMVPPGEAIQM
jgi:hypothetical protein